MRSLNSVIKSESEKVIGVDENQIPIIECPDAAPPSVAKGKRMAGRQWFDCPECKQDCLHEVNGRTYYHKLACSQSNGVAYGDERDKKSPEIKMKASDGFTGASKRALGKVMHERNDGTWVAASL